MGKSQRDKGYRGENNLRNLLVEHGIECRRVPLSGGAPGTPGDLIISHKDVDKLAEVKVRGEGFRELYRWIDGNDFLFVKADRKDYLAVMRLEDFIELICAKSE